MWESTTMTAPRYRLVVFDFDGTLADTKSGIADTVNLTLTSFGHSPVPNSRVYELVGLSLEIIFSSLVPTPLAAQAAAELVGHYRAHYNAVAPKSLRLFPGMREVLETLHQSGAILTVATSKGLKGIMKMLEALQVVDLFTFVISDTCVAKKKPDPEMVFRTLEKVGAGPFETVVVGDTTYDIRMGRTAGTHTCGVTYGSHSESQLAAESPTYIAQNPAELLRVILHASP